MVSSAAYVNLGIATFGAGLLYNYGLKNTGYLEEAPYKAAILDAGLSAAPATFLYAIEQQDIDIPAGLYATVVLTTFLGLKTGRLLPTFAEIREGLDGEDRK